MKRFYLMLIAILSICLLAVGCGSNTVDKQSIDTQITEQQEEIDTQEVELSELEKKIQEFENNTSSEITITQDVLRGKWVYGNIFDFIGDEEKNSETFRLGDVRIETDANSKNSYLTFSNNKFVASYEVTEARLVGDETNMMQGVLVVSGLYRVINEDEVVEDEYFFDSEIELLIIEISMQSEVEVAEIMDGLDTVIGETLQKDTSFALLGLGKIDELTEEQAAEYDMELPELIESKPLEGNWGYREDGSYGLTLSEAEPELYRPMTQLWIGKDNNNQLFTNASRMKTKYTVDIDGEDVEPGLSLYHALTREEDTVTE